MTETKARYEVAVERRASNYAMEMLTVLHDVEEYLDTKEIVKDVPRRKLLMTVREVLDRVQRDECEHDWELTERFHGMTRGYEIHKCRKCGRERFHGLLMERPER